MKPSAYNIRVYGLFLNPKQEVLVTDERRGGYRMTKFPGGGHEFGEGLIDGLMREFDEELGMPIEVKDLFYVNDFLQISAFNPKEQLLSLYYWVEIPRWESIVVAQTTFQFPTNNNDAQTFRWVSINDLQPTAMTFPVDKVVCNRLQEWFSELDGR